LPFLDITPLARGDMDGIFDHGVANFGIAKADVYATQLVTALSRLIDFPEMAPMARDRKDGSRRLVCGSHAIIYRIDGDRLHIARVLHQSMDPDLHG
jgi:toxin ParE1/3/4